MTRDSPSAFIYWESLVEYLMLVALPYRLDGRAKQPENNSSPIPQLKYREAESRVQGNHFPAGVKGQSPLWEFEGKTLKIRPSPKLAQRSFQMPSPLRTLHNDIHKACRNRLPRLY